MSDPDPHQSNGKARDATDRYTVIDHAVLDDPRVQGLTPGAYKMLIEVIRAVKAKSRIKGTFHRAQRLQPVSIPVRVNGRRVNSRSRCLKELETARIVRVESGWRGRSVVFWTFDPSAMSDTETVTLKRHRNGDTQDEDEAVSDTDPCTVRHRNDHECHRNGALSVTETVTPYQPDLSNQCLPTTTNQETPTDNDGGGGVASLTERRAQIEALDLPDDQKRLLLQTLKPDPPTNGKAGRARAGGGGGSARIKKAQEPTRAGDVLVPGISRLLHIEDEAATDAEVEKRNHESATGDREVQKQLQVKPAYNTKRDLAIVSPPNPNNPFSRAVSQPDAPNTPAEMAAAIPIAQRIVDEAIKLRGMEWVRATVAELLATTPKNRPGLFRYRVASGDEPAIPAAANYSYAHMERQW